MNLPSRFQELGSIKRNEDFCTRKMWAQKNISRFGRWATFSPSSSSSFISRDMKEIGYFFIFPGTQKVSLKILRTPTVDILLQSAISGYFSADPTFSTEIKIDVVANLSQLGASQQFWSCILVTAICRVKKHLRARTANAFAVSVGRLRSSWERQQMGADMDQL